MKHRLICLCAVMASPAAQASPTCDQVIAGIVARHPAAQAARATIDAERAARSSSSGYPLWLQMRDDARNLGGATRVGLKLKLEPPGYQGLLGDMSELKAQRAAAEAQLSEVDLAAQIRMDFLQARRAQSRRGLAEEKAKLSELLARSATQTTEVGLATDIETSRQQIGLAEARARLASARAEEVSAMAQARRWLDSEELPGRCSPPAGTASRLRLKIAEHNLGVAEASAAAVQRAGWLWPSSVEASWDRQEEPGDPDRVLVSVEFPIPGTAPSEAEEVAAKTRAAQLMLLAEENADRTAVTQLALALDAARIAEAEILIQIEQLSEINALLEKNPDHPEAHRTRMSWIGLRERVDEAGYEVERLEIELRRALGQP